MFYKLKNSKKKSLNYKNKKRSKWKFQMPEIENNQSIELVDELKC